MRLLVAAKLAAQLAMLKFY